MFQQPRPVPATDTPGAVALERVHDTCFRCGRPTPLGVSLCERDNPGRIKSPSSTQVHGTIVIGVLAGFLLLAVLLGVATAGVGPFHSAVVGAATRVDGGLDVIIQVVNGGTRTAGASCRVSAGGAPDYPRHGLLQRPDPGRRDAPVQSDAGPAQRRQDALVRCGSRPLQLDRVGFRSRAGERLAIADPHAVGHGAQREQAGGGQHGQVECLGRCLARRDDLFGWD